MSTTTKKMVLSFRLRLGNIAALGGTSKFRSS
jgi:hypothetical protein